ncbi:MAG: redoxin family protein, partial [Bacteroidota bacterium]
MNWRMIWVTIWAGWLCMGEIQAQTSLDSLVLENVDSSEVMLGQFKEKKALVLIFTGNHCVYSKKYEPRLTKMAAEYMEKDIAVCLVNSNAPEKSEDERMEMMRARAKEHAYPCPYLQDKE